MATIDPKTNKKPDTVIDQLSDIIVDYLKSNPRISLNGLSKRCQISEPTIRRIAKKQVKTVPTVSTVIDLLKTISRDDNVGNIIKMYPGPVADYIQETFPQLNENPPQILDAFKAISNFQNSRSSIEEAEDSSTFSMISESVSYETYQEIAAIQKETLKKIEQIVKCDQGNASIPLFFLSALNTLDLDRANDIAKSRNLDLYT